MSGPLCIPLHASTKCSWRSAGENRTKMDDERHWEEIWRYLEHFCCTSSSLMRRNLHTRLQNRKTCELNGPSTQSQREFGTSSRKNLFSLAVCSESVSLFQDEEVFSLVQNWAPMLNCLLGCKKWHLTDSMAEITSGMMKDHHYQSGHVWKSNMSRRQFDVSFQLSHRRHSGCAMLYHPISCVIPKWSYFVFIYCHLSMHQTRHFSNHLPPVFGWNICCSSIFGNSSQNVLSQKDLAMLKMTQGALNVKKILSILWSVLLRKDPISPQNEYQIPSWTARSRAWGSFRPFAVYWTDLRDIQIKYSSCFERFWYTGVGSVINFWNELL